MEPIIDAHVHVGTWDHADFLQRATTLADTLNELSRAGIAGAAVCPTDQCDNQTLLDDALAACAGGYQGKLWFFPWVRPVVEDSPGSEDLAWLEGVASRVTGLKIHPSLARRRLSDPGYDAFLDLAESHDWLVLVHCGRWQEIASYRFALEVAHKRPKVRFVLAHAGGDTPPLATAAAQQAGQLGLDNVWFEFSGVREFWVIERNVARLGAERYLMGSDYNLAHPLMYVGAVRGMNLTDEQRARILGQNALELFGPALSVEG